MIRKLGTFALALIILSGIILVPGAPPAFAEDGTRGQVPCPVGKIFCKGAA